MKKLIPVFILFIFASAEVNAQELTCEKWRVGGLCIEIEFTSMNADLKTPSKYEFPDLVKINDYLVVSKIKAVNLPGYEESKNTSNLTLKIDMYPFGFEKEDIIRFEETRYSIINIPPLKVNDVYELTYLNEWAYYESKLNDKVIRNGIHSIYPKKLFTDGDWEIEEKIEEPISYSTIIHGGWKNNFFKVYSNLETKELEIVETNLNISKWGLRIGVIFGLSTILISLFAIRSSRATIHLAKNHEKNLTDIGNRFEEITRKFEEKRTSKIGAEKEEKK